MFNPLNKIFIVIIDAVLWLSGKILFAIYFIFGWRIVYLSGKIIAKTIYFLRKSIRETTEKELSLLFGKRLDTKTVRYITKRSFEDYYTRHVESVFLGVIDKSRLDKIIYVEGLENLNLALSKGNGVILLLSHFGSFLLPLPFLGYSGYKVNQVAGKQLHTSIIAERVWLWRKNEAEKLPVTFIQADKLLRPVYQSLRNNEIVAIAFDGRDSSKWLDINFLERKVRFSPGPFELAKRTGASIVPTFVVKESRGLHKLVLESPFYLFERKGIESDLLANTQRFADIFAGYVTKYPWQFGMVLYKYKKMELRGLTSPFFVEP